MTPGPIWWAFHWGPFQVYANWDRQWNKSNIEGNIKPYNKVQIVSNKIIHSAIWANTTNEVQNPWQQQWNNGNIESFQISCWSKVCGCTIMSIELLDSGMGSNDRHCKRTLSPLSDILSKYLAHQNKMKWHNLNNKCHQNYIKSLHQVD